MTNPTPGASEELRASPLYYISFDRMLELNRSPVAVIAARRGESCPSRLRPEHELDDPQELVDEIADHSASEQEFIQSEMPLQEIVFRVLLSRRNQPTSVQELHHELTEKWATPIRPINVTEAGLERILENDRYYGFSEKSPAG